MLKIALEEHFDAPAMVAAGYDAADLARFPRESGSRIRRLLEDLDDTRIATMDACGIGVMVLSQTAPGVQVEKDAAKAARLARGANDYLAQRIARHPTRYAGFAHLALQDPQGAADELERCVGDLRFVGALVNHHTNGEYLDADRFTPFWERVVSLGVPVYLHPADPYDSPHVYRGCPGLSGPAWTWNCETSAHALRLVFAGTFDRFAGAKLILGHMGETIPFYLWRLDSRFALMNPAARRMPSQIIREHLYVTTSGVCSNAALRCTIDELGSDRVLFSTDYPYEDAAVAASWIDAAPLTVEERRNVTSENAKRILRGIP